MTQHEPKSSRLRLLRPVDPGRDHARGDWSVGTVLVVGYLDFLCPYCHRLRQVLLRARAALGRRLVYVFRHFPNEQAHPGAMLAARASEAAARQGRFWEMHDALFDREPEMDPDRAIALARELKLDVERFERDLDDPQVRARVEEDLADGRANGVTGTPTLFVDGVRYDGAWDYDSVLESLQRPLAARVSRTASVFASLPTSAGLVLLISATLALVCANTPLAPIYDRLMNARIGVGPVNSPLALTVQDWCSEGLLAVFFLLVGLEIRRETTRGMLTDWRAALLPVVAAIGGVVTPALIFLALTHRTRAAAGWGIPTTTDVAFTLGLLAVLGSRIPNGLRVFVAALAIADDILSIVTLGLFYRSELSPPFTAGVLLTVLLLFGFNRARVYALWPYLVVGVGLWASLHALGIHPALAGVVLAVCLPTRPAPAAGPLLAQAATALSELEDSEEEAEKRGRSEASPLWEWAARNLTAASSRLRSPADRLERAVSPWSAFLVLPLFAFSAVGVTIRPDFSPPDARRIFAAILLGQVIGKPLGILVASTIALATRIALTPTGVDRQLFIGAACLCGVADPLAFLLADRALPSVDADVAKLAVLLGSVIAGALGLLLLRARRIPRTPAPP